MQEVLAEQVSLGAFIAQTLEQLDPADLRGDDCVIILGKAASDGLERRQIRGFSLLDPVVKGRPIPLGQLALKPGLELQPLSQRGIGGQAALQGWPLRLGQAR
jgi:hypothetical protein